MPSALRILLVLTLLAAVGGSDALVASAAAQSGEGAASTFEIKDGDRVLLLGDTLLERENSYGYLELRMHEQFPDRKFSVRNLSWAGETPRGISRASFDPPEKGFERLKEQIALVKPTVVFLGFGMAASLQEMTDRAKDWTLNPDPARYGAEPMSAGRFKRELGELMNAIQESGGRGQEAGKTPAANLTPDSRPLTPASVRFVLLSPIRHEDLRATRPGLPDPAAHNALLVQYSKAIEELAKERGGRFVSLFDAQFTVASSAGTSREQLTDNGILPNQSGSENVAAAVGNAVGWGLPKKNSLETQIGTAAHAFNYPVMEAAILRKNALWFHRTRPANETYLTGFRKHEQGQNAKEIPEFDPLVEQADAEIDRLKRAGASGGPKKSAGAAPDANRSALPEKSASPSQNGGTPIADGGGKIAKGGTPVQKGGTPAAEGGAPIVNSGAPIQKGGADFQKGGVPVANGGTPIASSAAPIQAGGAPVPKDSAPIEKGGAGSAAPDLPVPQFDLGENLEITLWAENPLLVKPTQMNWDALGRLWVCGTAHYPQIAPGEIEKDQIFILEDTDRDGKADKSTVFAGGMLLPTCIVPDLVATALRAVSPDVDTAPARPRGARLQSACYVGASTEMLHFADTDGDGLADEKRIVFTGFGTEDTHHNVHTLKWGPDGRLYFDQSIYTHTHLETPYGMVRLNAGGVFAYDPRTERVEVFCKGLWNPWGHVIDRNGQHFLTDGAGRDGIAWAFPGAVFAPSEGARQTMPLISPGTYPKFAGLELIHSPHFPDDWQGTAVTCDFRAHRIVRFAIKDLNAEGAKGTEERREGTDAKTSALSANSAASALKKSGFVTADLPDVARTADIAFRPIDVKLGPDGALYIADWTNPVINHGEVDFRDPRRDKTHGRIWRITYKGRETVKWEAMAGKKNEELVGKLRADSHWESEQASRVLLSRAAADEVRAASPSPELKPGEAAGRPRSVFHELSLLTDSPKSDVEKVDGLRLRDAIGCFDSQQRQELLKSSDSRIRAGVARSVGNDLPLTLDLDGRLVMATPLSATSMEVMTLQSCVADSAPRVRIEAMRSLARIPIMRSADLILSAAVNAPADDPYYAFAAWRSINDVADVWVDAVLKGEWKPEGREKQLEFALKAIEPALAGKVLAQLVASGKVPLDGSGPWFELIGLAGSGKELRVLLDAIAGGKVPAAAEARALGALVEATRNRNTRPEGELKPATELLRTRLTQADAVRLLGLWKLTDPMPEVAALAREGKTPQPIRTAAFDALKAYGDASAMRFLDEMTRPEFPLGLRRHALVTIVQVKLDAGLLKSREVLRDIKNPDDAIETWRALLSIQGAPVAFAHRMPQDLPPAIYAAGLRAAREVGRKGQELVAVLTPLAGATAQSAPPADYSDLASQTLSQGDPAAGEEVYRRVGLACTVCHAIGGAGGKVGPELGTIGASAPLDYIIESLLNPNAKVKEGYNAVSLTQKDGNVSMGVIVRESANDIVIRTATGQEQKIAAEIIKQKDNLGSIMPMGLVEQLKPREKLNLYAFLAQLGKKGVYDASRGHIARTWWLSDTPDAKAAKAAVFPNVDGRLPRERLAESVAIFAGAHAVFASTKLTVAAPTKTQLLLTGVREAWLDGKPLAVASEPSPSVELSAGDHTFTVKLDAKQLPEVLRAEAANTRFLTE